MYRNEANIEYIYYNFLVNRTDIVLAVRVKSNSLGVALAIARLKVIDISRALEEFFSYSFTLSGKIFSYLLQA